MKNILSPAHREVLAQFAFSNVLLAFDYDGTLAPIVCNPERAAMRPPTRKLLTRLAKLYPCVVISGRAGADVRMRLRGVGVRGVVGNHGVETWHRPNGFARDVTRWRVQLQSHLAGERGVVVEDKGCSIAIHYRQARRKSATRAAILRAVANLGSGRLIHGKQVVNLLPQNAPHKGDALERERARLRCDTAMYVGDDETDEDVFSLDQPGSLLSIRVGAKRGSRAEYCVRDQRQVDALISSLVRLRSSPRVRARSRGRWTVRCFSISARCSTSCAPSGLSTTPCNVRRSAWRRCSASRARSGWLCASSVGSPVSLRASSPRSSMFTRAH